MKKLSAVPELYGLMSQPGVNAPEVPEAPVARLMYRPSKVLGTAIGPLMVTTAALAWLAMARLASASAPAPNTRASEVAMGDWGRRRFIMSVTVPCWVDRFRLEEPVPWRAAPLLLEPSKEKLLPGGVTVRCRQGVVNAALDAGPLFRGAG